MANKFIIEVRSKGFKGTSKDLDKVTQKAKEYTKSADKMRGTTAGLRRTIGALRNNLLLVSFAMGTVGFAIKKVVDAAAGFEAVKTRLVGLMGSVEAAEQAFKKFNQVAATTPFTLQDVVEAGAQLKAFGADAEGLIKPVTDLAAFMGTTATEAANSLGRAFAGGAGAADILRERGILNLIKTTQGLDDLSKTTLPDFRKALIDTIQDPTAGIAGSTDRMSKTYIGAMSNMGASVTRLAASIGDSFIPALISASQVVGDIADGLRRTNLKAYAAGFAAVTGAIALYNQAILIAKIRTIDFSATLAKTLWGAAAVGAGLLVGKMIELSGAMGEVNAASEEMEKRYERLSNLSGEDILKLGGSESEKRLNATKKQLRDIFTTSEQVIQALSVNVVKFGMDSAQVQDMITVMIKNGTLIRKDAGKADAVLFAEFLNKQQSKLDSMQLEEKHIAKLIEEYPKLAQALGLLPQTFEEFANKQREQLAGMFEEFAMIEKLKQTYPELAEAMGFMDEEDGKSPISLMNQDLEEVETNLNNLADPFRQSISMGNLMGEAITNAFEPGQSSGEALKSFMISFVNLLQQAVLASEALASALTFTFTGPAGVAAAIAAFATLEVIKGAIREQTFTAAETGFDGVVTQPTLFMTGEGNKAERVSVTPLQGPNINGPQGGGVTINISGGVVQDDYIRNELIPALNKATSLGARINA